MRKMILGLVLIGLIILMGCSTTSIKQTVPPFEFKNTGSDIDNYEVCYQHTKEHCDNKYNCGGFEVNLDDVICEGNRCMC